MHKEKFGKTNDQNCNKNVLQLLRIFGLCFNKLYNSWNTSSGNSSFEIFCTPLYGKQLAVVSMYREQKGVIKINHVSDCIAQKHCTQLSTEMQVK